MAGADLDGAVTTRAPYMVAAAGERRFRVAALDVGIKANTPRMLAERGIETHVLPPTPPIEAIEELRARRLLPLQRPGRPGHRGHAVALTGEVLRRMPLFGICFGNQILARALGRGTYKLRYGHRGINIPVSSTPTAGWRSRRRTTASPSRAGRASASTPRSGGRRSATPAPTTAPSRAWPARASPPSASSTTRRPRRARTTRPTSSTVSPRELMGRPQPPTTRARRSA